MEFDFTLPSLGAQPTSIWDSASLRKLSRNDFSLLKKVIEEFGKRSAVAQGLGAPVTDIYRLLNTDQRLYLYAIRQGGTTVVLGGLKLGVKKLFVLTPASQLVEIEPTCVLDFYVHESCQRQGIGKQLFEQFLAQEQQEPANLAYDRPSPKLLAFLQKHYMLYDYTPQNNNYVVFHRFFQLNPQAGLKGQRRLLTGRSINPTLPTLSTPPRPALLLAPLTASLPAPLNHTATPASSSPSSPTKAGSSGAALPPAMMTSANSFGQRWTLSNFGSLVPSSSQSLVNPQLNQLHSSSQGTLQHALLPSAPNSQIAQPYSSSQQTRSLHTPTHTSQLYSQSAAFQDSSSLQNPQHLDSSQVPQHYTTLQFKSGLSQPLPACQHPGSSTSLNCLPVNTSSYHSEPSSCGAEPAVDTLHDLLVNSSTPYAGVSPIQLSSQSITVAPLVASGITATTTGTSSHSHTRKLPITPASQQVIAAGNRATAHVLRTPWAVDASNNLSSASSLSLQQRFSRLQTSDPVTPAVSAASNAGATSSTRNAAVTQRSGAGAANCLVW